MLNIIYILLSFTRETDGFPRLGKTYSDDMDKKFCTSVSFLPSSKNQFLSTPSSLLIVELNKTLCFTNDKKIKYKHIRWLRGPEPPELKKI